MPRGYAPVCTGMHQYALVCTSMPNSSTYYKIYKIKLNWYAPVCTGMHQYALEML